MSVLSDALLTEALHLDGNLQYVVPTSTLAFLDEAAEVLMAQEARIVELEKATKIASGALVSIAHTLTENSFGGEQYMPAAWYISEAKAALYELGTLTPSLPK